jgi:multiple sugar transport system permease protein
VTTAPTVPGRGTTPPRAWRREPTARRRVPWFKYVSVLPLVLFFLGLVAYPVIQLIWMSFGDIRLVAGDFIWRFVGLENFTRMLSDDRFGHSLVVSLIFVSSTVVLTVALGVLLALATDRIVRTQQWIQNVLIWPAIIAPVVISVIWLLILSPQIGLLNKLLASVGLTPQTWLGEPVGAMTSIILVDTWHWTPIVFLFVYTALRGIDPAVVEAASVDGASYPRTVRHIILPLLTPAILGVAGIRVVMGVKAFDEMYLLTFGGPGDATSVITIYLRSVFFEAFQYGYGAALSVTVVLLVIAVIGLAFLFQKLLRGASRG